MVSDTLETERERPIEKEVIVSIDCHLVLELVETKVRVRGSQVVIKSRHHKLAPKMECGDFLRQ